MNDTHSVGVPLAGPLRRARVIPGTGAMIGERFDDPALRGRSARAGRGDAGEFTLQRPQLGDTRIHIVKMALRNLVSLAAWAIGMIRQIKQRADIAEFETERAGMANE